MHERVILGDACVAEGAEYLAKLDQRFANALAQTTPLPLRLKQDGFPALIDAICGQQVSVASARAIWGKLQLAGYDRADAIKQATDEQLRACGLSRPKVRYVNALAEADIDYAKLRDLPTPEVIKTLIAVKGIGQWTAEIYAMFSLGRADVLASGDLALQESARVLFELDTRPTDKELAKMAEAWAPWRAVAARLLWAYYRVEKNREGIKE